MIERLLPVQGFRTRDGTVVHQCDACVDRYNANGIEGGHRNLRTDNTVHLTRVSDRERRPICTVAPRFATEHNIDKARTTFADFTNRTTTL